MSVAEFFDLGTFLVTVTVIQIFIWLLMVIYGKYRKVYQGFSHWAFHLLAVSIGNISMIFRDSAFTASVIMVNISMIIGFLLLYEAVSRYYTKKPVHFGWYSLLILLIPVQWYFSAVLDLFSLRNIFLSCSLAVILIPVIRIFFINPLPVGKRTSAVLGIVYILLALVLVYRAGNFWFYPEEGTLYGGVFMNFSLYVYSLFVTIIASFIFILLNLERLAYDLILINLEKQRLATRSDLAIKAAKAGVWEMEIPSGIITADEQVFSMAGKETKPVTSHRELHPADYIHDDDFPRLLNRIKEIQQKDEEFSDEYKIILPDGEIRHHLTHAQSIENENGELRLIGLTIDITPQKRTQEALQEALRKLSTLYSITRHDILNAVTVITMTCELLLEDISNPQERKMIEKIAGSGATITDLIRFTAQYQQLGMQEPHWVDPALIFSRQCDLFRDHNLVSTMAPGGMLIYADPMIEKVLFNLIENSIRHGERVKHISLSYEYTDKTLHIIYADDGIGIREEQKNKIFEKGFGRNTGMGLFLCREIVEITGILITEEGEYGKGARFVLTVSPGLYRDER